LSLSEETQLTPVEGLAWRAIDDEVFLYQPSGALHIFEGPVAHHVWQALDSGTSTVKSLRESVLNEFDVESDEAEKDLHDFLNQLIELQILKIEP